MTFPIAATSVLRRQAQAKRETAEALLTLAAEQRKIADELSQRATKLRNSATAMERLADQEDQKVAGS